ncbi:MAG: DUF6142 family protein [Lachnospiraceae bacterium]|nr:DUF6142 family protein [Lachnospiraceae bacterium]
MFKKYIFTDKNYSPQSIMSTILGIISGVSLFYAVYFTYQNQGIALPRYGASVLLILILAFVGLIMGILSKSEPDRFYFFSYLGIVLNILVLCGISFLLFAGAYGL